MLAARRFAERRLDCSWQSGFSAAEGCCHRRAAQHRRRSQREGELRKLAELTNRADGDSDFASAESILRADGSRVEHAEQHIEVADRHARLCTEACIDDRAAA